NRRNNHLYVPVRFASETATRIFTDQNDVVGLHIHPSSDGAYRLSRTLRSGVKEQLPVLPVGHGAARLHALVTRVWRHKSFIENQIRFLEAGIQIAVGPLVCRRAHWHLALRVIFEILLLPLE